VNWLIRLDLTSKLSMFGSGRGLILFARVGRGLIRLLRPSYLIACLVTGFVLLPVFWLVWLGLNGDFAHWGHLARYVLPTALMNTSLLLLGVAVLVSVIGAGCAWLVTFYDFPGRKIVSWALFLPLAMPTYIVAFVWLDILHPLGPVQGIVRAVLGFDSPRQFRLPDLRSMPGAIMLLGFVLYPYVYLTLRAVFVNQPAHLIEAARVLGQGTIGVFWHVVLPLARPALAVGIALALLETLNDIGASEFLGISTLTTTIYTTWVTRSDLAGAAQIACAMLGFVLLLLSLEYYGRKRQRYALNRQMQAIQPKRLTGRQGMGALALTSLPIFLGFVAPALFLAWESFKRLSYQEGIAVGLLHSLQNSLFVSLTTTLLVMMVGLFMVWFAREGAVWRADHALRRVLQRLASLGYAVPGTVLAIGLLAPMLMLDRFIADLFGLAGLPMLSLGIVLIAGCAIHFLTIAIGALEAGLSRISPTLEQAARLLGAGEATTWRYLHLPLLLPSLATASLLVFADVMKDLSTTLLLRPVNFETLSTLIYAEAARGTYEEGAMAALLIVFAGIIPVILLGKVQMAQSPLSSQRG